MLYRFTKYFKAIKGWSKNETCDSFSFRELSSFNLMGIWRDDTSDHRPSLFLKWE